MQLLSALAITLLVTNALSAADKEFSSGSGKDSASRDKEVKIFRSQNYGPTVDLSFLSGLGSLISSAVASVDTDDSDDSIIVTSGNTVTTYGDGMTIVNGRVIGGSRSLPSITGSGTSSQKLWNVGETQRLTGIQASGVGRLEILRSTDKDTITVTADDNIIDKLSVSLSGEDLVLTQDGDYEIRPRTPIVYTVRLRPAVLALLNSINTRLTTNIKAPLSTESLSLSLSGAGSLTAEETLKIGSSLDIDQSGAGAILLANTTAGFINLNRSGMGSLDIAGGSAPSGTFNISGMGATRLRRFIIGILNPEN